MEFDLFMQELMPYEALKERLWTIPDNKHRALLCTIYGGMARVGEITRGRYTPTKPLFAENVKVFEHKIEIHIRSEKTNTPRKVPIFKNREQWLADVIESYANVVGTGPLFPYSTRWAEMVFVEHFPEFKSNRTGDIDGSRHTIHWLRGWRYSHYRRGDVTGKPVDSKVASLLGGWVSSSTPERCYDFTKIDDYEEELENMTKELELNQKQRDVIRKELGNKCAECELSDGSKMRVHHIDYNKYNNEPSNLILLCQSCHSKTTSAHYKHWKEHYTKKKREMESVL